MIARSTGVEFNASGVFAFARGVVRQSIVMVLVRRRPVMVKGMIVVGVRVYMERCRQDRCDGYRLRNQRCHYTTHRPSLLRDPNGAAKSVPKEHWPLARHQAFRCLALLVACLVVSVAHAQRFGYGRSRLAFATADSFDGAFQFCRAAFRGLQGGDGGNWLTDYPDADRNLSIRLSELTKTPVSMDPRTREPNHVVVRLTAPELYRCPFIMMFEVGNLYFDAREAAALRDYLQKGGFLWVDDFWGERAWDNWESQIRKVFPSGSHPIVDLPVSHPLFHQFRSLSRVPQIPSINYWLGSGGDTSERFDSREPHIRVITDERRRIMVLMSHNTDFGDSYERESVNREYFLRFSVEGYAFGINALIYAMTH